MIIMTLWTEHKIDEEEKELGKTSSKTCDYDKFIEYIKNKKKDILTNKRSLLHAIYKEYAKQVIYK